MLTSLASASSSSGLTPAQVLTAYSAASFANGGSGQTIAIVDAYNDPNVASDLKTFDAKYGLATANLTVVNESGGSSLPSSNAGWSLEISLDVEWAHAMAPSANILLVEASSDSLTDLLSRREIRRGRVRGDLPGQRGFDELGHQ